MPSIDLRRRSRQLRFTIRRPPTGEVSPCGHRPSGGDIACSVDVGVAPSSSTDFALEDRLALAVSGCDVPARGASLRRVGSRNLLDPAQSLVLQTYDQLAPAASADYAVEPTFLSDTGTRLLDGAARRARHTSHVQSLDPDHVEPPRQVGAGLLHPVLTPVPLAGFQPRDRAFRLLAAMGTAPGAGQPLLQHLQPFRLTRGETGCMQQLAARQRSRHDNTTVDADHTAVTRTGNRAGDMRERHMPPACPITSNPVRLDTLGHRPRKAKTHPPDLGHPDPTKAAIEPLDMIWLHPNLPETLVHNGLTPSRAAMRAGEEVPRGLREIPQRLLLHRVTSSPKPPVLGARLRQLRALLAIAGSRAARLPVRLLLDRQIPHIPRIPAMAQQCLVLLRGRQQPKPRHTRTITTTTDIRGVPGANLGIGFLPVLMSGVCNEGSSDETL